MAGVGTPEPGEGASPARLAVFADGGTVPSDSQGGHTPQEKANAPVPVRVLLMDVPPPGWFCLGGLRDVPKDACYVGHSGDRYAWVTADGVPALARLTLTTLSATKLKPTSSAQRGLAFTR